MPSQASAVTDALCGPLASEEPARSWWGPATAIGFVALLVASFAVAPMPPPAGAAAEVIRAHFVDHAAGVRICALLQAVASVPFLLFVCWLSEMLGTGVSDRRAAAAILGAGILILAVSLTGAAVNATLAFGVASHGDASVLKALFDFGSLALNVGDPLVAVLIGGHALATARRAWMPRWLTAFGFLVAVSWIVGSASVVVTTGPLAGPTGPFGTGMLLFFMVWVVAVSLALRRRERASTPEGSPRTRAERSPRSPPLASKHRMTLDR